MAISSPSSEMLWIISGATEDSLRLFIFVISYPKQLRKMMGVVVVVSLAFGLTVRLRTKGMPESTAILSIEAAGQVYNQTIEFVNLGGISTTMSTCPSRSTGHT